MSEINRSNTFRYIQDARREAFERPGNERIIRNETGFEVAPLDAAIDTERSGEITIDPRGLLGTSEVSSQGLFGKDRIKDQLQKIQENSTGSAQNTVEFLIDDGNDGSEGSDLRYVVSSGKVRDVDYRVSEGSETLRSPEVKGLEIIREVMERNRPNLMLNLTPAMVSAVQDSQQLSLDERIFVDTQFNSSEFQKNNELFSKFFGQQASYQSAGVSTFEGFMERMSLPENRGNLELLYSLGENPDRFAMEYADRPDALTSMANTFKDLPGFRRYPQQHAQGGSDRDRLRERRKTFDHALRTIDQYQYKFRVSQGMQFNRDGMTGYQTEASYRWDDKTLTIGVAGKDYDFGNPFDENHSGGLNQLDIEYRSPDFDLRTGVKRERDGGFDITSPRSDWADRFMDDARETGKSWAKENPWKAAAIGAGVVGGAWAYSHFTGDDVHVDFDQRFDLYNSEAFRLRAEISPEVGFTEGVPDLGLSSVGLGMMGNKGELSYNTTIRHKFQDTSIASGEINHKETDLNARLSYRSWALESVNRWDHDGSQRIRSEFSVRKNFVIDETSGGYVRPLVRLDNGKYDDAGAYIGYDKQIGRNWSIQADVGYTEKQGETIGIRTSFQF